MLLTKQAPFMKVGDSKLDVPSCCKSASDRLDSAFSLPKRHPEELYLIPEHAIGVRPPWRVARADAARFRARESHSARTRFLAHAARFTRDKQGPLSVDAAITYLVIPSTERLASRGQVGVSADTDLVTRFRDDLAHIRVTQRGIEADDQSGQCGYMRCG